MKKKKNNHHLKDIRVQSSEIRLVNCARNLNTRRSNNTYLQVQYMLQEIRSLRIQFQLDNINIQHLKNLINLYMLSTSLKETLNVRSFPSYCRLVQVFVRLRFKSFSVVSHVHSYIIFLLQQIKYTIYFSVTTTIQSFNIKIFPDFTIPHFDIPLSLEILKRQQPFGQTTIEKIRQE